MTTTTQELVNIQDITKIDTRCLSYENHGLDPEDVLDGDDEYQLTGWYMGGQTDKESLITVTVYLNVNGVLVVHVTQYAHNRPAAIYCGETVGLALAEMDSSELESDVTRKMVRQLLQEKQLL